MATSHSVRATHGIMEMCFMASIACFIWPDLLLKKKSPFLLNAVLLDLFTSSSSSVVRVAFPWWLFVIVSITVNKLLLLLRQLSVCRKSLCLPFLLFMTKPSMLPQLSIVNISSWLTNSLTLYTDGDTVYNVTRVISQRNILRQKVLKLTSLV